ncbi:MAG: CCA tRNA nucleotidyltransferase [Candidatus Dormibacteria bacterium]
MASGLVPDVERVLDEVRAVSSLIGLETYLVGGFVRDRLLGRETSKDIDLLTVSGDGRQLLEQVAHRLGWSRPQTFDRFGTAQIRHGSLIIETVRARSESYDPASRKPDVSPGTLEEDIWRRDFTVNALCQTLDGRVIDVTGMGLHDLRAGVLRTPLPPGETFREDPLRMFRAARFSAQLGFSLTDGILEAMRSQASRAGILSVERISDELRRLLTSPRPRAGVEVLRMGNLLDMVLPEVTAMIGVEQSGYHIHDVYDHTTHALDHSPADLITRTAVLLHDVGKPSTHALAEDGRHTFHGHDVAGAAITERILARLRYSNEEIEAVSRLVRLHLRPIAYNAQTFGDSAVRRLIREAGEQRNRLLDLARADTRASSYPDLANIDALAGRMRELDNEGDISRLTASLSGEEIMAMGGLPPGPWVGRVKRAIEEAILDGEIPAGDAPAARRWLEGHRHLLTPA